MYSVGDLVEVSVSLDGRTHHLIAIITSVDEAHGAFHCRAKDEASPFRHVVANESMLRMIQSGFVAEDRKRLAHLTLSRKRKVSRKMGHWWLGL